MPPPAPCRDVVLYSAPQLISFVGSKRIKLPFFLPRIIMKRKDYAILIELECIHERLCRILGKRSHVYELLPNVSRMKLDKKESITLLKRECIKTLLEIH